MAPGKEDNNQEGNQNTGSAREVDNPSSVRAENNIVGGEVSIAGRDIYKGYTAEQVSVLLAQITSTFQPKPFDGRCPYKGLDVFEEEDADLFFGRERLVEDLLGRVKESRAIFIIGPAGSGKSSLVRAGLIHALKQGAIKNLHSERWLYETMRPGREPIKDLARTFSRLKSLELEEYFRTHANQNNVLNECAESVLSPREDQRFVLFVDQFEEVFTQISQEEERLAFLNMLVYAATVENGRVIVLFAVRSDFVSNFAMYPQLNALLNQQFVQIGAMRADELVSAIAQPALRVGLRMDSDLISNIINDMKGEPGALPLMQFALKDLFDSQQEKGSLTALTLNDYLMRGGIHMSLERHADHSFAALSESEQQLARSIFSALIEIGRGTADTPRTALFDEVIPANTKAEDVKRVVQKLADARLITTDEQAGKDTVMISHGKLIEAWPWLRKLVNENRDVIILQNKIANDAQEWEENHRDPSYLYTGTRLANILGQRKVKRLILGTLSQEFVDSAEAWQKKFSLRGILQEFLTGRQMKRQLVEQELQTGSRQVRVVQRRAKPEYKKFALLIGNNEYDDAQFAKLTTAQEDVMTLADILQNPQLGGFEAVKLMINQSFADIQSEIADFFAEKSPQELLLLYFSGHGMLDPQGRLYLAAKNTRHVRPSGTAISSQFLTNEMDSSRSKRQILILDCCHSGAFSRGTKGAIGVKAVTRATFEGDGVGRVVLTATDATQFAWESDQILGNATNSVFTHFLVEGLKSGEADQDHDGQITLDELYEYVYEQIRSKTPKQTPKKWVYGQEGEFVLAYNPYLG
jgi:energy-coupling factor transporter ATP-binding protein EcfA2